MSLKNNIEKIFLDNTNYTNPVQAVNQASSLNALSNDLYTDSRRFIYELLQNADDSSQDGASVEVWIKTLDDSLVIAHSGRPFTIRDLQGICNVNNGTKKLDLSKTGYKGIGFKSVFGQSDHVTIFTKSEYFRFDSSYQFKWKWEISKTEWEQENDRKFQFPWQIIPIYTKAQEVLEPINQFLQDIDANVATIIKLKNIKETTQAIHNLSQNSNMFLFLKYISRINFYVTEPISIEINRKGKNRITLKKGNCSESKWLVNTVNLTIPIEIKSSLQDERNIPEKLLNTDSIELSLSAKIGSDGITKLSKEERLLYSYLPTDEIKYFLPVIVNTSFLTTANRESLHADSKWNQWLFKTIAIEIFKWISKLVNTEFEFQAYRLIPEKTIANELGLKFNEGIEDALKDIPFIVSRGGQVVKVDDAIIDFTFLSEKKFIGEEPIKKFIDNYETTGTISSKKFAKNISFGSVFKKLGAACFEWKNLQSFLFSISFSKTHTTSNNIKLIKHFKSLSESNEVKDISIEKLENLPFIWDHKNNIKLPKQVCFPTADDQNWNNPENDFSFLHQDLQCWLLSEPEMRVWLETLGMTEKTDITYITQTIIPHIDSYITHENAIQTIKDLFILYRKGDLSESLIRKLSRIKLLTQKDTLCPAKDCFLSNFYSPRIEIEDILELDIFVNESYCLNIHDKDEWKRFFKMMGVNEGISVLKYQKRLSNMELINVGFKSEYFDDSDKKFKPLYSTFSTEALKNIATLSYIKYTENNPKLSFKFWKDLIINFLQKVLIIQQ